METAPTTLNRARGLDSIRFISALWVFFGHGAAPQLSNPFSSGSLAHLAFRGFYDNIWSGPAPVIVFFVISGFCIHYPFAGTNKRPCLREFYTRRLLRLFIPIAIAMPLSGFIGVRLTLFQDSILWSLLAELIYYLFYHILRPCQMHFGSWRIIVAISFVAAFAVAATRPSAGDYPSYGPCLNRLLGLPCWLLGCVVAESVRIENLPQVASISVWAWRATIFTAAWICSVLRFHSPFGYPWALNLFSVLVALCLHREIVFRQRVGPAPALEWAGLWSYSLYLIHLPALALFARLFPSLSGNPFRRIFLVIFVFAACYIFYLLIGRPNHAIARSVGQKLRPHASPVLAISVT